MIGRVKPAGWGFGEKLTSTQANSLDVNIAKAVDRTSAGDTVSGLLTMSGAGRIARTVVAGADSNTTYTLGSGCSIIHVDAITANRNYTLSDTGATLGDVIEIFVESTVNYAITVKDNGSTIIAVLGWTNDSEAPWASFIWDGQWLPMGGIRRRDTEVTFTAGGTWTCPRGVTHVRIRALGGGGGGGGGSAADWGASGNGGMGGGGGGGARMADAVVAVTPGLIYTIAIGAGGTSGTKGHYGTSSGYGGTGGDGGDTTFSSPTPTVLMTARGAAGGPFGQPGATREFSGFASPVRGNIGALWSYAVSGEAWQWPQQAGAGACGWRYVRGAAWTPTLGIQNAGSTAYAAGGAGGARGLDRSTGGTWGGGGGGGGGGGAAEYPGSTGGAGGNGGDGGNSATPTTPTYGANGAAGTSYGSGAGGGGGGASDDISTQDGGAGGVGGDGILILSFER